MRLTGHVFLLCAAFGLGCGSPATHSVNNDDVQLRLLGRLYGEFMAQNSDRPPRDEAQFKEFLGRSTDLLKSQGIASLEDLLISPRDGQPIMILYGEKIIDDTPNGFPWIAYESQGVNGKKCLIGARGNVEEMTQEQVEALTKR